jgi:hypothetical protein
MTDQPTTEQITAMTPAEAGAHLAAMTAEYVATTAPPAVATPSNATEARARLSQLASDKNWATAYLNGDTAARQEFDSVTKLISTGSDADMSLAGVLPEAHVDFGPGASLRDQVATVPVLRQMGIGDDAIRQLLEDMPVSQGEHQLAEQWRHQHMKDADWTKRWLAGEYVAAREMTLCNIILASEIDERK